MSEIAKRYFKSYPNNNECHETSDGFVFDSLYNADSHARTLSEKKVMSYKREELTKDDDNSETKESKRGRRSKIETLDSKVIDESKTNELNFESGSVNTSDTVSKTEVQETKS
jgi:hypothetical protein